MLGTFLLPFIFPKDIADLQERPQQRVLGDLAKNLNTIKGLSEGPNTC